jgi:rare lipoprotein A
VPKPEVLNKYTNRPYTALGQDYVPDTTVRKYKETGLASWYGRRFNGKKNRVRRDLQHVCHERSAPYFADPELCAVTSLDNGKSVVVRINDRGPFHSKRIIDLSYTAAHKLGIIGSGSGRVEVESVTPGDEAKKDDAPEAPGTYLQLGSFSSRSHAEKALADATAKLNTDTPLLILAKK